MAEPLSLLSNDQRTAAGRLAQPPKGGVMWQCSGRCEMPVVGQYQQFASLYKALCHLTNSEYTKYMNEELMWPEISDGWILLKSS